MDSIHVSVCPMPGINFVIWCLNGYGGTAQDVHVYLVCWWVNDDCWIALCMLEMFLPIFS